METAAPVRWSASAGSSFLVFSFSFRGMFRLMPSNVVQCHDVIRLLSGLRCGLFALGDQHGDVVLLFVRAEAANGVHERGKQVRQRQVAVAA